MHSNGIVVGPDFQAVRMHATKKAPSIIVTIPTQILIPKGVGQISDKQILFRK